MNAPRKATIARATRETDIQLTLVVDGTGTANIRTGLGFYDHMLESFARHSGMDIDLQCRGDVHVDDHHTVEDCAIALGQALDTALGDKRGIARFADAAAPLDEALARAVVDLSGRPYAQVDLALRTPRVGDVTADNLRHALETLALHGKLCLHVDVVRGVNDHHKAEAAFKATALAFRAAVRRVGGDIPSTKGVL